MSRSWDGCVPNPVFTAPGLDPGGVRAGVDRVELRGFGRIVELAGGDFLDRIYTANELAFCRGRIDRLATRLAAKEATAKLLGTGMRGLSWQEIEVVSEPSGEPRLRLHDRARARADALGIVSISVSLTHTTMVVEAFVVALTHRERADADIKKGDRHDRREAPADRW